MNIYTDLEINKIIKLSLNYFFVEDSRNEFEMFDIETNPKVIQREHLYLNECLSFYQRGNILNLPYVKSLNDMFSYLDKGGVLDPIQLYNVGNLLTYISIIKHLILKESDLLNLNDLCLDLIEFNKLKDRIFQVITPEFEISNNASSKLNEIRRKLFNIKALYPKVISNVLRKYNSYLSEVKEGIKNGLPAIAIKPIYKNKVDGIVADVSNTGNTIYIIPTEILNLENETFELKSEEKEEINRILLDLTNEIRLNQGNIFEDYKIIKKLDSIFARTNFGLSYQGVIAEISDNIELNELGCLLIEDSKIIRNSIKLGEDLPKILLLSGPNAGGKSVLIKSVALACIMNQKLLLVPCLEKSKLKIFDNIFVLLGDNQSVIDNLSTFSSHIKLIDESLKRLTKDSLFIVDEIGQGTSPKDGQAIGIGVIKYLFNIDCYSLITSHYDGLKEFGIKSDKILIGAMIFDEISILPTFKYKQGQIGKSYALEVASNLGLINDVIIYAKEYLKESDKYNVQEVIDNLNKKELEIDKLKQDYTLKLEELEKIKNKRENSIKSLETEKEAIILKANKKIEEIVDDEIEKIDELYKLNKIDFKKMSEIKGKLKNIKVDEKYGGKQNKKIKEPNLKIGDKVFVNSLNNKGFITDINKDIYIVNVDGFNFKTKLNDLKLVNIIKEPKLVKVDDFALNKSGVSFECNLIGLTKLEAINKLDKYMDDVILARYHEIRIIHGFGSGILRNAVIDYLKKNKNVKSYRSGGELEGGLGATVVYLK